MFLENILPILPFNLVEAMIYVVAGLGCVLIAYAVFLELERRQDLVFMVGAGCLFVYALYVQNIIFMIAMAGLFLATLVEFTEIYIGLHKHSPEDLKRYKDMR